MHGLLKEKYTRADLDRLVQQGKARPFHTRGAGPATSELAGILNQVYAGHVDIRAMDNESRPPVFLWARVDSKDGVPWDIHVTYLLEDLRARPIKEVLMELARHEGLATERNWPSMFIGKMWDIADFWPGKEILQIGFLNLPPGRVIAFLRVVEEYLLSAARA